MFSRRSLFIALGLALPMAAVATAEAATTPRTRARRRSAKPVTAAKPRRQRRVDAETIEPAKG